MADGVKRLRGMGFTLDSINVRPPVLKRNDNPRDQWYFGPSTLTGTFRRPDEPGLGKLPGKIDQQMAGTLIPSTEISVEILFKLLDWYSTTDR